MDLVINLDLPWDTETYLHRVGRAGRFGGYGLAVSLVSEGDEALKLKKIADEIKYDILFYPGKTSFLFGVLLWCNSLQYCTFKNHNGC